VKNFRECLFELVMNVSLWEYRTFTYRTPGVIPRIVKETG